MSFRNERRNLQTFSCGSTFEFWISNRTEYWFQVTNFDTVSGSGSLSSKNGTYIIGTSMSLWSVSKMPLACMEPRKYEPICQVAYEAPHKSGTRKHSATSKKIFFSIVGNWALRDGQKSWRRNSNNQFRQPFRLSFHRTLFPRWFEG